MFELLPERLPWYVAGPGLGLLIVAVFAVVNQPLGASSAYVQTTGLLRRGRNVAVWRVWYFAGMFAGGLIVTQLLTTNNNSLRIGYDDLRDTFPLWAVVPLVFGGATLLGYGSGIAGGCTSGHGMCGTAQRSPASAAVTITFLTTAIATTFALNVATGGSL